MKQNFKISPYGNMLMYGKKYSVEKVLQIITENNLNGLRIFDVFDRLVTLDFLNDYIFLENLSIDCAYDQDYSFLTHLVNLKQLSIGGSSTNKNIIDLSGLINLKHLGLDWRKGRVMGLDNCQNLEWLTLVDFKEIDLNIISSLINLKELQVKSSSIKSSKGLESLVNLEKLGFGYCRYLSTIDELQFLKNLKYLCFDTCSKIYNFEVLGNLDNIEVLEIGNCKDITSIGFIENLKKLNSFVLSQNTRIVDGDLKPALRIKDVFHTEYKHYNINAVSPKYHEIKKQNLEKYKNYKQIT